MQGKKRLPAEGKWKENISPRTLLDLGNHTKLSKELSWSLTIITQRENKTTPSVTSKDCAGFKSVTFPANRCISQHSSKARTWQQVGLVTLRQRPAWTSRGSPLTRCLNFPGNSSACTFYRTRPSPPAHMSL